MRNIEGKWSFNKTRNGIWNNGLFDTKEDAINEAKRLYDEGDAFYIGQATSNDIGVGCNVDSLLEDIALQVYDEVGEVAEDYLAYVEKDHRNILEERINNIVLNWMKEFEYEPSFYKITNVEKMWIG